MKDGDALTKYNERFSTHISHSINLATEYPNIRRREFEALVRHARLQRPKNILEAPAEGKIMEQFYSDASIFRMDLLPVNGLKSDESIQVSDWSFRGITDDYLDAVLSLVPIHHADSSEKILYLSGAHRVLKSGGVLAFGEVEHGSRVHNFLDGFVNEHTKTGHIGTDVDEDFAQVIRRAGFDEVSTQFCDCEWIFGSLDEVCRYVSGLFALKCEKESLLDALDKYVGLREVDGKVALGWKLRYFRGVKP